MNREDRESASSSISDLSGPIKARSIIAAVIDHRLANELKKRGFRKKGFVFTRRHGDTGQVVRLELSSWSAGDRGMFSVWASVMFDDIMRIWGREPPRMPGVHDGQFFADLRQLVEGSPPTWEVDRHTDIAKMSELLCGFVVDGVLSRLDGVKTLSDFEETGWVPVMHWRFPAIYAYAMGRMDEAERLLRDEAAFFADRGVTYEELVERCRLAGLRGR
ncbi:DUF4304 domain-containing protein [Lysobacter capsici]|uniref:DUF4304 domain-containing protein n=1 Tax=Lysobacter capsici TaxID=435897 RepID=UPI00287BA471|nr:DUF4304 domain-containing protein [Lysobacter capsici]WND79850.1 DUF4304 domain-containing protein [Lysobacter capsici]WND85046.1 DUF4304 domain-containing protein [Lysobacter capsici]